jgi:hypothetical protein
VASSIADAFRFSAGGCAHVVESFVVDPGPFHRGLAWHPWDDVAASGDWKVLTVPESEENKNEAGGCAVFGCAKKLSEGVASDCGVTIDVEVGGCSISTRSGMTLLDETAVTLAGASFASRVLRDAVGGKSRHGLFTFRSSS